MKKLWEELRIVADQFDTAGMATVIVQILKAIADSEPALRSLHTIIQQHEPKLLAAGNDCDVVLMSEILGDHCRVMFANRREDQPMTECDRLILVLKEAGDDADMPLMASTFEHLYHLSGGQAPTGAEGSPDSKKQAANAALKKALAELPERVENLKRRIAAGEPLEPLSPRASDRICAERASTPAQIGVARERVIAAVQRAQWDEVAASLAEVLWSLAEVRPDFEELPSWIADARKSGVLGESGAHAPAAVQQVNSILRSVVSRYGDDDDRHSIAKMEAQFLRGRSEIPAGDFAVFTTDVALRAARLRQGSQRLPLALHNNALHIGRHTNVSFHRTLRIPEDGRAYPLPAGFGRLPIVRVEDYPDNVPGKWLEQGGFIIPLYQREALFLEFAGVKWRPTVAKVSVGRVNAISGKEHDLKIRPHRQDYVVIPDQRWLDGINSGDGSVSQFVAMPLGHGYTIEAQVTDEEKYGGFQLAVFDPRRGRFPELDPKQVELAALLLASRSRRAAQDEVLRILPEVGVAAVRALQKMRYYDAARSLGISEDDILEIVKTVRLLMGKHGLTGFIPEANLKDDRNILGASRTSEGMALNARRSMSFMPSAGEEMGIAAGGRIKQQILEDSYGAESWDEATFRDVVIHIVNSEMYQRITGCPAPPSPITADQYHRYKIPWYSDYDEKAPSVAPVGIFKRILTIGKIDKNRGIATDETQRRPIQQEDIVRIRTQTLEERWKALVERARLSSQSGYDRIAAREASQALDLSDKHPLPFLIRAVSNHRLGLHADAEADASACLKLQPDNLGALSIRAYSSLALGEVLLAKEDAEKILAAHPDDDDGLYVRAEASLRLGEYGVAVSAAKLILQKDPANPHALRIRSEGLSKLSEDQPRGEEVREISEEDDELVAQCIKVMREEKAASTSLFQYRLGLGYTEAARMLDILETLGYVGPGVGAKPRDILKL